MKVNDTLFIHAGYSYRLRKLEWYSPDSCLIDQVDYLSKKISPKPRKSIQNLDSVIALLSGKVTFNSVVYDNNLPQNKYIASVICQNGMKLIFNYPVQFERYYPDYKVAVFTKYEL